MASVARKDLLKKVYNMVPPMLESFHKGTIFPQTALKSDSNAIVQASSVVSVSLVAAKTTQAHRTSPPWHQRSLAAIWYVASTCPPMLAS